MTAFQPIVHGDGKLCQHASYARAVSGWALDCDEAAAFIRTTEYGGHEYACGRHVAEMEAAADERMARLERED